MISALLAGIVAVLGDGSLAFIETQRAAIVGRQQLPGRGLAIFAAPDGRLVVPLAGLDSTAVVTPSGSVERWPGRLFPLFVRETDRMYAVLPGALAQLSYPDRVQFAIVPLPGVVGARRAASSFDGRLVAVVPEPPEAMILLVTPLGAPAAVRVALAAPAVDVVVGDDGGFVLAAGEDGGAELVAPGEAATHKIVLGGSAVRCVALAERADEVLIGAARGDSGELILARIDPEGRIPFRELFRARLPAPPVAIARAGEQVVVVTGEQVIISDRRGRRVRARLDVTGGRAVAALRERPSWTAPAWRDSR